MHMHAHAHVAVPRPRAGHFFPRCAFFTETRERDKVRVRYLGGFAGGPAGGAGHVWTCATWPRAFGFAFWRA